MRMKLMMMRCAMLLVLFCSLSAGAEEVEEVIYYDIWLGNTQVTSENQDNILGQTTKAGLYIHNGRKVMVK